MSGWFTDQTTPWLWSELVCPDLECCSLSDGIACSETLDKQIGYIATGAVCRVKEFPFGRCHTLKSLMPVIKLQWLDQMWVCAGDEKLTLIILSANANSSNCLKWPISSSLSCQVMAGETQCGVIPYHSTYYYRQAKLGTACFQTHVYDNIYSDV